MAPWTHDSGLASEVGAQFRRAIESYEANSNLITEHANHEEIIRVGGYANRTLLELVQNAADAMSGDHTVTGRVEIILDPDNRTLYCANAGRPFSKNGLVAIAHAHLSGKRGDEIGRFGLGFKSVLAVTETPQVFSRSVSFEFNSPEAKNAIAGVGGQVKRYPVLRTPTLIDAHAHFTEDTILEELSEWAATVVKLPDATNLNRLRNEIESFSSEFLLFVSSVREVRLRVLGEDGFETSHVSRELGNGLFKIERPDSTGDEWLVEDRMHSPSHKARKEVGEAVSRSAVKVTVAVPVNHSQLRIGRFWSYFPLQDQTSASALFNAPWSVNDDRTTLLRNDYNREILRTLAEMFVDLLPRLSTPTDPAAHLDYLPARGREERSFGDSVLYAAIPRQYARVALIPDAHGELARAEDLRPLDLRTEVTVDEVVHRTWIESPNTGDDVPHWRCYTSSQRMTRLRELMAYGFDSGLADSDDHDMKRVLENIPTRGILSWLREWAEGNDFSSAADALRFILNQKNPSGFAQAKVIPTTAGLCGLHSKDSVFLEREEDIDIENAEFVEPQFLAQPGVKALLRKEGFRNLDPIAIFNARVYHLSAEPDDLELSRLWDAALNLTVQQAVSVINDHSRTVVKVPTCNGGWSWPQRVIDIDEPLAAEYAYLQLDRSRCVPDVAHAIGVVREPIGKYSIEDEPLYEQYCSSVLKTVNEGLGPGERPLERISVQPSNGRSPGPFSMLIILDEAQASFRLRVAWTYKLLGFGDEEWDCEDLDSGNIFPVPSPVRWAYEKAGLVESMKGIRFPGEVVAPSLTKYGEFLPLFMGPRPLVDILNLPDELEQVPPDVLREGLDSESVSGKISDSVLTEFVVSASRIAYPGKKPPRIPARVGRAIELRSTKSVFVAVTDEEREFLISRQRPYLVAAEETAADVVETVGCRKFEDAFTFSVVPEGQQADESILDVLTGLRNTAAADRLMPATVTRAANITKYTTTEHGVEDESLEWHLADGVRLFVQSATGEERLLKIVNDAFELNLNNAELAKVRQVGLDHRLEQIRQAAQAATTDAERLEIYFGEDDLREELPKGLWQALEAQNLVDSSTSVGELHLTVRGSDAIKFLAELFRREGFPDVPQTWAGGAATISWLRKMGFSAKYAGRRAQRQDAEFVIPGVTELSPLHDFQKEISLKLREILTKPDDKGRARKAMVELPTGAGKTRVASETILRLFIEGKTSGNVLWIAQSQELCEQAVQTFSMVWRGIRAEHPLTIGRLWEGNDVHRPETEFGVIVATDAQLDEIIRLDDSEYSWLKEPAAVVVDEAHRAGDSERYTRILAWLGVAGRGWERPLVGLSATPFKGRSESGTRSLAGRFGDTKISAFDENPYKILAERGFLAHVKHEVLPGAEVTLSKVERDQLTRMGRVNQVVLDRIAKDRARMSVLLSHILDQDQEWPILVFTPNVLSAQVLAAMIRYQGRSAASVSGQTGRQERREIIQQFQDGEIRVLTNCDVLIQGFDAPGVRALYIARPTFSPSAYIQMAGRGLRGPLNGGKDKCLIVDMEDNFGDINDLLGFREYEDLWNKGKA
ncbi:sacsin N-terminal ATP-binding-like domain-containing protein [Nocardia rhamnosiphila]|uniref:sacsin N-terminal ATP-binding-like domain-containing protein n=1 Tax=Nocardia rhamnosiphila TaxID=426716 RepID=UPI0004C43D22|nr:DEAD/DEAH box helicase family protein [Nocardia rhamnosiphila]